ncbi:Uncharacterised protein [Leclercia adecarboxylata]|uniref:Uncharacterized protein n=1 Tax=Leclercia adecarboxylata TaxID=83655 RepID=A0A4U9HT61_9ENTR|nr:Uncharacterised protein [Leclercia adecarboxylata]
MRRTEPVKGGSTRDQVFWQALRSRLSKRPVKYEGVTTMALTVRTGNRLGGHVRSPDKRHANPALQWREGGTEHQRRAVPCA